MKCPYCGSECPDNALYCDVCKQPLPNVGEEAELQQQLERAKHAKLRRWMIAIGVLVSIVAVCVSAYKVVSWIDSYKLKRLYTRGAYTPTLNLVNMADGRQGHALVFYGEDGDVVYLPEIDKSLSICGGVARLEIADADWFYGDVSDYDYAEITFAPVLMKQSGAQIRLPVVNYNIDVPESPLTVISPEQDGVNVVTSSYPLEFNVVAGSSVFVNGTDVTDRIDRAGDFEGKVSVEPIGDNTYTIIVRTPQHKEVRRDVTIYRQKYDIEIELDEEVSTRTSENTMTIKGKCEPGAVISVDTDYIEESLIQDMATGEFSFIALVEDLGENVIRFRASMEGRNDAVVTFTVNYKPTLGRYAANAWKMDYEELRKYYETWLTRVFKCTGPIVDVLTGDDGKQYMIMDVSTTGEPQYVALQNDTTLASPTMGPKYTAYADVAGRYFYRNEYYPMLIARYIDLDA